MSEPNKTERPELARRQGTIFTGTLKIVNEPARMIMQPFEKHFEKRYLGRYRHAKHLFIFDLVLLGVLLALAGTAFYLFFLRQTIVDKIALAVEPTPTEIVSGDRVTFTVFYENQSEEPISNVELQVRLPRHFEFLQSYPLDYNPKTGSVFLGTLEPGAHGQAKVTGILWGSVGRPVIVFTALNFMSGDPAERHIKFSRAEFPLTRSVLALSLEIPSRVVGGHAIPFTLTYENTGSRDIPELSFIPQWPDGTAFLDSVPAMRDGHWYVGALPARARGSVTGSGRIAQTEGDLPFGFIPLITVDGDELMQAPVSVSRPVIAAPLRLAASFEGAETVLEPGMRYMVRVAYENQGVAPLEDVKIGIRAPSRFIEEPIQLVDQLTEPALARLAPGASGTVTVPLELFAQIAARSSESNKNFTLTLEPIGRYLLADGVPLALETTGPALLRRIESTFDLAAFARYWTPTGDQIGRGPLPPVVGETTKYWIFWNLSPTTNDLEHLELVTVLPSYVDWTGRSNVTVGSPIIWNAESRTVTWTVDRLEATAGSGQTVSARFEVAFTPTPDQIGTKPILLKPTVFTARDLFTETDLSAWANPFSIDLFTEFFDRRMTGKGTVEAP